MSDNEKSRALLEKYFDTAFAAPEGIKKLRELILTLAMQGKLVPQDPSDQPASELLKEIEAEKRRLVKAGKIREPKPLPEIKPDEVPYALPISWAWVRLNDFGTWKSGTTPSRTNSSYFGGDIPWVKSGEVKQGRIWNTEETITKIALENCSLDINPVGSVLIAMYGANIGETGILEIEATTNQAVCACKAFCGVDNKFLACLISSLKQDFIAQGAGAAQPNISREKIIHTLAPLPPFAEQKRLVTRIDQLMARCDELEKLRAEREAKRQKVHSSALNRLFEAQGNDSFTDAWHFINRHFGELYSVKQNTTELRNAILQLGVMGKLVPQDPNDQPASELLKEIEAEKRRLVKAGKIREPKPLPEIKPDEVPYALPVSWAWVRLGEISEVNGGFAFKSSKYVNDGVRVVRISDFDEKGFKNHKIVRYTFSADLNIFKLEPNNILMAMTGGTVGKSLLVKALSEPMVVNQRVATIKILSGILPEFVNSLIQTDLIQRVIYTAKNSTNDNISMGDITGFYVPLPPFAEQKRIVTRIDQFMAMCDELEHQIDATASKQSALLSSVMVNI